MKLHSVVDCITNSSSTTFIVGFEKLPLSVEETFDLLFPDGKKVIAIYGEVIPSLDAANAVFNDIAETKEIVKTKEELIEKLRCGGVFPGYPEYSYSERYAEIDEIGEKFRKKYGEKAMPRDHEDWHKELQAAYKRRDM